MESPCIQVCTIDDAGHCHGCRRTLSEIANWARYSDAERTAIMRQLKTRRPGGAGDHEAHGSATSTN